MSSEIPQISHDDLMDVLEMSDKLEDAIDAILDGNSHNLAMSALIGATVNSILFQCNSLPEILYYKSALLDLFDFSIKNAKIQNLEPPA